jgi:hypothetical protein
MSLPAMYPARISVPPQSRRPSGGPPVFLEPAQLTAATQQPVPRARLGQGTMTALWGLRVVVIILSAMVIYTFVCQLGR